MHEVKIATNGHSLQLIFHHLFVHKVAEGTPTSDELRPITPVDVLTMAPNPPMEPTPK